MVKEMTSTNYLSPQDFKKMIDAIPLVTEYNKSNLLGWAKDKVPNPRYIRWALWVQYCCALRISEVLNLEKEDFNFKRNILTLNNTKTGKGKKQYTSIPPDFPKSAINWISFDIDGSKLFKFNRQLMWRYVKLACEFAKLEIGEQQDQRYIEGGWTHLIRKSRAKMMDELGCKEGLIARKLRHTWKNTTDRYVRLDINALIEWERENIGA